MDKLEWRFLPGHMLAAIGIGGKGLGPNGLQDYLSKWQNIVPVSPIDLEGMPPTNELLAGIVCLSPTQAGPLRDAAVAQVVGSIKDKGLNL